MRAFKRYVLSLLILVVSPLPGFSQRDQLFIGARPIAMGETFVAIADDGNSSYWNPAGMVFSFHQELNAMYSDLYGLGINNGFLSVIYPLSSRHTIGGNWVYDGFDDDVLGFENNLFTFSYALAINKHFSIGTNLKYIKFSTTLDKNVTVADRSGFGQDIGAYFSYPFTNSKLLRKLQLGVMAHDVTDTKVNIENSDANDTILRRNVRFGVAVQLFDQFERDWLTVSDVLLAADFDDRWHVGAELWLNHSLALRGGLQNDFDAREGAIPSFGAGIRWKYLQLDYAYAVPPTLEPTHRFAVSLRSEQNPWWITIEKVSLEPVFASLYLAYQKTNNMKIGTVFIKNTAEHPVSAVVSLYVKDYMRDPTEWEIILPPDGEITTVRLQADFSEKILDITGNGKYLKAEVKVRYRYHKDYMPDDRKTAKLFVHGSGTIVWEDPGRAAAFVTKEDPCVRSFAEKALTIKKTSTKQIWAADKSEAVKNAMKLYDALNAFKINYIRDPNRNQNTLDTIFYPRSLLSGERRAGDCDDLSVLFASLLESCGIETAFLSTNNHFFMMLNTGLHPNRPLPYPDDMFVKWHGNLWLPVETTVIAQDKDFLTAWKKGAENYHNYLDDGDLEMYHIAEQQSRYPAPDFTNRAPCRAQEFFIADGPDIKKNAPVLEQGISERLKHLYKMAKQDSDSLSAYKKMGLIWALVDSLKKADKELYQALQIDPTDAQATNNLANVKFMQKNLMAADSLYERAIVSDPSRPGTYLNRAILSQYMYSEEKEPQAQKQFQALSDVMLQEAVRRLSADTTRIDDLIGHTNIELSTKAGLADRIQKN